jgi:hypothetical protein
MLKLLKACQELMGLLTSDSNALKPWAAEIDALLTAMKEAETSPLRQKSHRIVGVYSEDTIWFSLRHRDKPINLKILRNELNLACGNGAHRIDLDTAQEARDVIEALLQNFPTDIVFDHILQCYQIEPEKTP